MFQSGEVDYLVATDAIGMGLNMDVNHVWFASLRKYDGRLSRPLRNVELAQIAGRAGRYMNDGTFGTTATWVGSTEVGRGDREPSLRSVARPAVAQQPNSISAPSRPSSRR